MPLVNKEYLVSIIVPVYKTENYLRKCVDSILASTYTNLEVILVDDGSPDGSGVICDEYAEKDARVKVVHKKNGGLSSARNAGLDVATGDFITFVDSDDTIKIDAIYQLISAATTNKADIVKMRFRNVGSGEATDCAVPVGGAVPCKKIENEDYLIGICTYRASCSFCDKLFKRDVFDNNYRFNEGRTNEDLLLLSTLLIEKHYSIYELDYYGYYYLCRENSITRTLFGRSITDTVYNCIELDNLAIERRPELSLYFKGLLLYQIRTFLILMPTAYIRDNNEAYLLALTVARRNKRYIRRAFFSIKDKFFLRAFLVAPTLIKKIFANK